MNVLAHFTPAELPGTLAVLLLGISIGALVVVRRTTSATMLAAVAGLLTFAALGYAGDAADWGQPVRIAVDVAFLAAAATLLASVARISGLRS